MSDAAKTLFPAVHANRASRAAGALLLIHAAVSAFLEVQVLSEREPLIVPVAILGVLALGLGLALLFRPIPALCTVAAVLMLVDLIGAGPHELANVASPNIGHAVFGVIALLIIIAALAASAVAAMTWRTGRNATRS